MARTKTPKQLEISIRSLKSKVTKLEAQRKRAVEAAKKKPAEKRAVKKKVAKRRPARRKAVKKKRRR